MTSKGLDGECLQLVLPECLRPQVMESLHNCSGHQDRERTFALVRKRCYWPGMQADVIKWIERCEKCKIAKTPVPTIKPSIGLTPYFLLYGREPRLPADYLLGTKKDDVCYCIVDDWFKSHKEHLEYAWTVAGKNTEKSVEKRREFHGSKSTPCSIDVGTKVIIKNHVQGRNKIQDVWKSDPYIVTVYRPPSAPSCWVNEFVKEVQCATCCDYQEVIIADCFLEQSHIDPRAIPTAFWDCLGVRFGLDDHVACAHDGWGAQAENFRGEIASLYIQAWILDSCNKHFSTQFILDKRDTNTVERVSLDSVYNLDSVLVSVLIKVFCPNNEGFMFHAGGSAMIDTSNDPYGAIIYGYNETEVMLWRPSQTNTNGHLVYVGGEWGDGQSNQESDVVEVIVKVIDITESCPSPPTIANADVMVSNNVALYSCRQGFLPKSGTNTINCFQSEWQKTNLTCFVVCSAPPAVENAAVFVQDNRAKYFCLTGYFTTKNTVDVIECRNSTWPSIDLKCIKSCPDPPTIANADVMVSNNVALYSCRQGFLPKSGSNTINCLQSEWQKTNLTCYVVCSSPPAVENAAVLVQDNRAKYFCITGYFAMKNTSDVIECRNSTWPSIDLKCIKSCPHPPTIANADVMVSNNVALYSCRQGFLPKSGTNSINCLQSEWQKTNLTCYASSCGPVPNITNADFLVDNDVAMYACLYGYRPTNANNKITCISGKWTHTSLQCQDTTKGLRGYITNETLAEWIKEMKKNLSVHKSNTSAYNRSLISVYESRPSAVQIGSVGVFLISFTIIVLIFPDIVAVVKNLCKKINKKFCQRRRGRDAK
ncbi:uncharacterized protein LOC134275616 [Saccostrea cucullata]|uniref:uncharacterized protein LOC134275616 n=1 Tax=Saccostrea cuccullata TaxID=36930 RepID=UPI002ED10343